MADETQKQPKTIKGLWWKMILGIVIGSIVLSVISPSKTKDSQITQNKNTKIEIPLIPELKYQPIGAPKKQDPVVSDQDKNEPEQKQIQADTDKVKQGTDLKAQKDKPIESPLIKYEEIGGYSHGYKEPFWQIILVDKNIKDDELKNLSLNLREKNKDINYSIVTDKNGATDYADYVNSKNNILTAKECLSVCEKFVSNPNQWTIQQMFISKDEGMKWGLYDSLQQKIIDL